MLIVMLHAARQPPSWLIFDGKPSPMKIDSLKWMVIAASILIGSAIASLGADARKEEAATASKLITAIEKADYEAFVSDGEPAFKKFTKDQFASVSGDLPDVVSPLIAMSNVHPAAVRGYLSQRTLQSAD